MDNNFNLHHRINMLELSLKDEQDVIIDYSGLYVSRTWEKL
jgi:hypothetical protein